VKSAPAPKGKAPEPAAPAAPPQGELERLQSELRRVEQQISRIAGVGRPSDASRQQRLAEKQDLLAQKISIQSKIRSLTTRPPSR
jgi:hypothetical protein